MKTSDHAIGDEEVDSDRTCLENYCVQRTAVEEENHEIVDKGSLLTSEILDSQSHKLGDDNESNEWKVYWDSFYGRSYFYNLTTQESTWEPPLGMEHLAYSDESHNLNELAVEVIDMDSPFF